MIEQAYVINYDAEYKTEHSDSAPVEKKTSEIITDSIKYFADDGLMALHEDDFRPPYNLGGMPTVKNDNGILFAAYYYFLLRDRNMLDAADIGRIDKALALTMHPTIPGLYLRNDDRTESQNTIDNYVGTVALLALLGNDSAINDVIDYGISNLLFYNNVNPGKRSRASFRHPAELAWYAATIGSESHFALDALFSLSSVFSSFQDLSNTSNWLLQWLHYKTIDLLPSDQRRFRRAKRQWINALHRHGGIGKIFEIYFTDPKHPIRKLSEGKTY